MAIVAVPVGWRAAVCSSNSSFRRSRWWRRKQGKHGRRARSQTGVLLQALSTQLVRSGSLSSSNTQRRAIATTDVEQKCVKVW